jgi:hypothetical protein
VVQEAFVGWSWLEIMATITAIGEGGGEDRATTIGLRRQMGGPVTGKKQRHSRHLV